ncbi:MAG TPA: ABC transporter substrate-binding protein, partial [Micromonosporaceae bacterium]
MSHGMDRRTILRCSAGLAAGVLAGGLVACSSNASGSNSQANAKGKRGGTLRFAAAAGNAGDAPDPAKASRTLQLAIAANCYDTLTRADQNYNLSPALATEWTPSAGGQTWTFKLRSGVTFHDGSPLTSNDVAYTFKRILDPSLAASGLATISPYVQASGIDTSDPSTVVFNLV